MIELKFKCVRCGKTWTHSVDEHDTGRYFKTKKDMPHPDAHCPCGPRRVMDWSGPEMESVCNCCDD